MKSNILVEQKPTHNYETQMVSLTFSCIPKESFKLIYVYLIPQWYFYKILHFSILKSIHYSSIHHTPCAFFILLYTIFNVIFSYQTTCQIIDNSNKYLICLFSWLFIPFSTLFIQRMARLLQSKTWCPISYFNPKFSYSTYFPFLLT